MVLAPKLALGPSKLPKERAPENQFAALIQTPVGPEQAAVPGLVAPATVKEPLAPVRETPFGAAPVAVTLCQVIPPAPIEVLATLTGVPLVVATVLPEPVTVTVPPPVAEKALL